MSLRQARGPLVVEHKQSRLHLRVLLAPILSRILNNIDEEESRLFIKQTILRFKLSPLQVAFPLLLCTKIAGCIEGTLALSTG